MDPGDDNVSTTTSFRERHTVPLWAIAVGLAWCTFVAWIVGVADTPLGLLVAGSLLPAFLVLYAIAMVVEVHDGDIVVGRRAGGRRVPIDRIVARRVLHGPALREVRNRLTPSFRLHCPIYERIGIQIVTVDDDGRRVEHLYAVRDHPAFLRATGAEDHSVEVQRERGVPV